MLVTASPQGFKSTSKALSQRVADVFPTNLPQSATVRFAIAGVAGVADVRMREGDTGVGALVDGVAR